MPGHVLTHYKLNTRYPTNTNYQIQTLQFTQTYPLLPPTGTGTNVNKEILEEAYIMASVDHLNLLQLLAVCMTTQIMLVTQLMPLGCLLDYVRNNKDKVRLQAEAVCVSNKNSISYCFCNCVFLFCFFQFE